MSSLSDFDVGHMQVADGSEYYPEWSGKFVIEACHYWNRPYPTYARPDWSEWSMGDSLGTIFDTREEAEAALAEYLEYA